MWTYVEAWLTYYCHFKSLKSRKTSRFSSSKRIDNSLWRFFNVSTLTYILFLHLRLSLANIARRKEFDASTMVHFESIQATTHTILWSFRVRIKIIMTFILRNIVLSSPNFHSLLWVWIKSFSTHRQTATCWIEVSTILLKALCNSSYYMKFSILSKTSSFKFIASVNRI